MDHACHAFWQSATDGHGECPNRFTTHDCRSCTRRLIRIVRVNDNIEVEYNFTDVSDGKLSVCTNVYKVDIKNPDLWPVNDTDITAMMREYTPPVESDTKRRRQTTLSDPVSNLPPPPLRRVPTPHPAARGTGTEEVASEDDAEEEEEQQQEEDEAEEEAEQQQEEDEAEEEAEQQQEEEEEGEEAEQQQEEEEEGEEGELLVTDLRSLAAFVQDASSSHNDMAWNEIMPLLRGAQHLPHAPFRPLCSNTPWPDSQRSADSLRYVCPKCGLTKFKAGRPFEKHVARCTG